MNPADVPNGELVPTMLPIMKIMETTLNPMDKMETTFLSIDVSQTTIMPTEEMETTSIHDSLIYNQEPRISLLDVNMNLELNQGLAEETATTAASATISSEGLETASSATQIDSEDLLLVEKEVSESLTTSDYLKSDVIAVNIDSTTLPSILNNSGKFYKNFKTICKIKTKYFSHEKIV